jgi:hypothetical protein
LPALRHGSYLDPDPLLLQDEANGSTNPRFAALNQAIVSLVRSPSLSRARPRSTNASADRLSLSSARSRITTSSPSSRSTRRTPTRSTRSSAISTTRCSTARTRSLRCQKTWTKATSQRRTSECACPPENKRSAACALEGVRFELMRLTRPRSTTGICGRDARPSHRHPPQSHTARPWPLTLVKLSPQLSDAREPT